MLYSAGDLGGVVSLPAGPGQDPIRARGSESPECSEDLAVSCIENGPKIHPRGTYCLITFR